MTRQDFELIAEVIKEARRWVSYDGVLDTLSGDFAAALAQTNPSFDYDRFLRACGVED